LHKCWYSALIAFTVGTISVIILLLYGKPIPDISQGALPLAKDIVSLIVPIASFVIGTYYARKAQKLQQEISGRKPELKLLINRDTLIPDSRLGIRDVVFGFSVEKGARIFCVIPFVIINNGELSAHNVHLRVILPSNISVHGLTEINTKKVLGDLEGSGFRRKSYEYENRWILDYLIPEIIPGIAVGIEELVDVTYSSAIEFDVDAMTKDNLPVTVTGRLPLVSRVSVSMSATDIKPLSNFFFVKSFKTRDEKEIAKRIKQQRERSLGEQLRELNAEKAVPCNLVDLLRKAHIVIPELRKIAETKEDRHFTALYVEQPKQSKRWVMDPAPKDGVVEIDLKRLMSSETSKT